MYTHRSTTLSRIAFLLIAIFATMFVTWTPKGALADTPTDGRINEVTWVNSWGAIAVYCVDKSGSPSRSFSGGGIKILNSAGKQVLFADESAITSAQAKADTSNKSVAIKTAGGYTLYALANHYFQINSRADNEGKTFLGRWLDCNPVKPLESTGTKKLCSENSLKSVQATFVNNTSSPVAVYWMNYQCNEVFYANIPAGGSWNIFTFVTHPWRIKNQATGAVVKEFVISSSASPQTINIP